jgi:methionyl-tRNA synthetase
MRTQASRDTSHRLATQPRIIQPEESAFVSGADAHATSMEQQATEEIRTAVSALEQRIT